jgi:hypothetical protein
MTIDCGNPLDIGIELSLALDHPQEVFAWPVLWKIFQKQLQLEDRALAIAQLK